jgi:hypothetical protein
MEPERSGQFVPRSLGKTPERQWLANGPGVVDGSLPCARPFAVTAAISPFARAKHLPLMSLSSSSVRCSSRTKKLWASKMPPASARANSALFILLTTLFPVSVGRLLGLVFADTDRFAVFLPLDDDPNPRSNAVVEAVGNASGPAAWDILMHGYFWPSHDRRSIPGVTDNDSGTGDNAVRAHWNRAVRDELLLPLLPSAIAVAVTDIPEDLARPLLEGVVASRTIVETCRR